MRDALLKVANTSQNNTTGITLNVSPGSNSRGEYRSGYKRGNTVALTHKKDKKTKKRSLAANLGLFALIAIAVAGGTFATGFAVISSLLRSRSTPTQQAEVNPPRRQPSIFQTPEEKEDSDKVAENESELKDDKVKQKKLKKILTDVREGSENAPAEKTEAEKEPKTLTKIDVDTASEINIPILTTGTSESQLVSTLGKPSSERKGWQPNSKVLVYYDVVPDRVNLSYQADDTGKIRQTDIALNSSVSLGAMQQTLSKMLGGDASADIKEKLRQVYNRQTNFSFFKTANLEGKVQRDTKDRVTISVWETGFTGFQ